MLPDASFPDSMNEPQQGSREPTGILHQETGHAGSVRHTWCFRGAAAISGDARLPADGRTSRFKRILSGRRPAGQDQTDSFSRRAFFSNR